jgi:hypothetical protein
MMTPRRRRRVGGLALAIPLATLVTVTAGRAEEPVLVDLPPVTASPSAEAIPELPGIPNPEPAAVDRPGESLAPAAPDPLATPLPAAAPAMPPGAIVPAAASASATPIPALAAPPAAGDAPTAGGDGLVPTGGYRPAVGMPTPQPAAQDLDPGPGVRPSAQGPRPVGLRRPSFATASGRIDDRPAFDEGARSGAASLVDGAGKIVCGFGKMLRGTGEMIGSGFHAMGNATERLFGAGDHLMNQGGHRLFRAAGEVAPRPGVAVPAVAPPPLRPAPQIVPSDR